MNIEIQEIIARVLEGRSSAEERRMLADWIKLNENNRTAFRNSEALWNACATLANKEKFDANEGYDKFVAGAGVHKPFIQDAKKPKLNRSLFKIAASIIIAFAIYLLAYHLTLNSVKSSACIELNTPIGSHTRLALTDGTEIWVNAGSKLRYPGHFSGKERIVYLEGEAFFNVKKDPSHPFIVKTSNLNVKALGTTFNVKAYPGEGTIETTLVDGIVMIEENAGKTNQNNSIRLMPNQKATYIRKEGRLFLTRKEQEKIGTHELTVQSVMREKESVIITTDVNTELYTSWIDNKLVFDNETFESIASKLERRYGAVIRFRQEEIKSYRFSGKFPEISIDRALNALQFASPFHYEIKQDTIFINP